MLGIAALVLAGCGTMSSDPPCAGPVTVVVRPGQATRVALVCFVP